MKFLKIDKMEIHISDCTKRASKDKKYSSKMKFYENSMNSEIAHSDPPATSHAQTASTVILSTLDSTMATKP